MYRIFTSIFFLFRTEIWWKITFCANYIMCCYIYFLRNTAAVGFEFYCWFIEAAKACLRFYRVRAQVAWISLPMRRDRNADFDIINVKFIFVENSRTAFVLHKLYLYILIQENDIKRTRTCNTNVLPYCVYYYFNVISWYRHLYITSHREIIRIN